MNDRQKKAEQERLMSNMISKDLVKAILKDVVKSASETFLAIPKKAASEISTIFISPQVSQKDVENLLEKHIKESLKSLAVSMGEKVKKIA